MATEFVKRWSAWWERKHRNDDKAAAAAAASVREVERWREWSRHEGQGMEATELAAVAAIAAAKPAMQPRRLSALESESCAAHPLCCCPLEVRKLWPSFSRLATKPRLSTPCDTHPEVNRVSQQFRKSISRVLRGYITGLAWVCRKNSSWLVGIQEVVGLPVR